MSTFKLTVADTGRGNNISVQLSERRNDLFINSALTIHPTFGLPVTALQAELIGTFETLQEQATDLSHNGFLKRAEALIAANVAEPFNDVRSAAPAARRDLDDRFAPFNRPRFSDDQPPAVRVEQRQWARTLPLPQLMEATARDPGLAAAVIEGGPAMSGLSPDIMERMRRDMAITNATTILMGQRTFQSAPTADDPVGGKPDDVAARKAGEALIKALEAEAELIEGVPAFLASIVSAIALVMDETRDQALARLVA